MHVGSRSVLKNFYNVFVFDSDETDISAKTFAACSCEDDIWHVLELLDLPNSLPLLSKMAEVVSTINKQEGIMLLSDLLIEDDIGRVRVHWEKSFSNN